MKVYVVLEWCGGECSVAGAFSSFEFAKLQITKRVSDPSVLSCQYRVTECCVDAAIPLELHKA